MRKLLLITALAACAIAAPAHADTVQELLGKCTTKPATEETLFLDGMNIGYCDGLIDGVLTLTKAVCVPANATRGQAAAIFIAWAQRNPQKWNEPAIGGAIQAFQEAWPCK